ncbi:MAG: hypothetical protein EA341_16225 [Mongoliibacter sp.]|uniref:hypothetical protein n=1 Tax=Mongoliibacter sp. TaxID=2022438 RepID=UPI0012F2504F|nr:hypothetical protein [Mongoliibacter sp.]TVP44763.1 MAG: hypothetical protein EA341_16225 [Mongoliibacter sp.]
MTEEEFDLLDELYFVQPYSYLSETLGWDDEKLLTTLKSLHQKAFIKCLSAPDEELFDQVDVLNKGKDLFYLASKKGLMEHNAI